MNQSSTNQTVCDTPTTYPCPRCGRSTPWQGNAFKPFCSARCQLIDLGAWASEDYKIAAQDAPFSDELVIDDER